jgi:hypothetical protein
MANPRISLALLNISISLITALAMHASSEAQVTIKEYILIDPANPSRHVSPRNPLTSLPGLFLVAPTTGVMQLEVYNGSKMDADISTAAYLKVAIPETTFTTNVRDYWDYFSTHNYTPSCPYTMFYRGRQASYPNKLLFMNVTALIDTMSFLYHPDVDLQPYSISGPNQGIWTVYFYSSLNDCRHSYRLDPTNSCVVYLKYADTSFVGFRVTNSADTIKYGGADTLRAIAISSGGNEVQINPNAQITFNANPTKYGGFKKTNSDTVTSSVPYSDARNGNIVYISDIKYLSDTIKTVSVSVKYTNDTSKTGTALLRIKRKLRWQYWSQLDSLWKNKRYGDLPKDSVLVNGIRVPRWLTVSSDGCAMTCSAMALYALGYDTDPGRLDDWLVGNSGYDSNRVVWPKIMDYSGELGGGVRISYVKDSGGVNQKQGVNSPTIGTSNIDGFLDDLHVVVAQVWNATHSHWVVVTSKVNGDYYILDPGNATRTKLSEYSNTIYRLRIFK